MSEHTPVPWRDNTESGWIETAEGVQIAQTWNKREEDFFNADANRAFIVRACNAHDDLLAALQLVMDPNGHFYDCLTGKRGTPPGEHCSMVCIHARAAIRKAEGA